MERDLISCSLKLFGGATPSIIVAIDEVGRGCIAGPVVVGASVWVFCDPLPSDQQPPWLSLVGDSKKCTPKRRALCNDLAYKTFNYTTPPICFEDTLGPEALIPANRTGAFFLPKNGGVNKSQHEWRCLGFALGQVDAQGVDRWNIWIALQVAAARALRALQRSPSLDLSLKPYGSLSKALLLIDGNRPFTLDKISAALPQMTCIGGDSLFISLGLSSIVAKVYRDRWMESQDGPYFFSKHKGYGTKLHYEQIKKFGTSPLHRLSFGLSTFK